MSPPALTAAQSILAPFLSDSASPSPAAKAVAALGTYLDPSGSAADRRAGVVEEVRDLVLELEGEDGDADADKKAEEGVVRAIAGSLFILEGEKEEAVATLTEGAAKTDLEW